MTAEPSGELALRRNEVMARAIVAVTEAIWQHRGQPLEGMDKLQIEARVAAVAALEVFVNSAELWADCAEQLAQAARANEDLHDQLLRRRRPLRRPGGP